MYIPVFIVVLFSIVKKWKQLKFLLTDEWTNKMWSIYTLELYAFFKRK